MCSNLEDDSYADLAVKAKIDIDKLKKCRRCSEASFVLLQKKDPFCRACFDDYFVHKFRSTIGKTKLVQFNDKVLIAYSGGAASSTLIHMIKEINATPRNNRRFTFEPIAVYVDESALLENDETSDYFESISSSMVSSGWKCFVTTLEQHFRKESPPMCKQLPFAQHELKSDELANDLRLALKSIKSLTGKEEFVRRIRTQLLVDIAKAEGCQSVFIGSTGTRLSIQLITDIAQGKGNQIHLETGIRDERFEIPIMKPLREFVTKEITYFNRLHSIEYFENSDLATAKDKKASLAKLTESFINDLAVDFPATVYTLYRISAKVIPSKKRAGKCGLCNADNDLIEMPVCSAQSALDLSRRLSRALSLTDNSDDRSVEGRHPSLDLVCYGCSIVLGEMDSFGDVHDTIVRRATRDTVQDFLLDE